MRLNFLNFSPSSASNFLKSFLFFAMTNVSGSLVIQSFMKKICSECWKLLSFKLHFTTSRLSMFIKNFYSWWGLSSLCWKRRFRQSFPTETWQPSSRIKILDGTLDGGLDVVKCSFSPEFGTGLNLSFCAHWFMFDINATLVVYL